MIRLIINTLLELKNLLKKELFWDLSDELVYQFKERPIENLQIF